MQKSKIKNIIKIEELDDFLKQFSNKNRKKVLVGGCFDILHFGHIRFLQEAKKLGDILIVALESDENVKRLKEVGAWRGLRRRDTLSVSAGKRSFCEKHKIIRNCFYPNGSDDYRAVGFYHFSGGDCQNGRYERSGACWIKSPALF